MTPLRFITNEPLADLCSGHGQVAHLIAQVAQWDGFAASVATKVLHKKRPRLIPILDNQAIFGAYMNPPWPQQRPAETLIREALEWI